MLVGGTYRIRAGVDQKAGLKRFQTWQPPADFTVQGHWTTADGMGGMFIAESSSAAAAFEAAAADLRHPQPGRRDPDLQHAVREEHHTTSRLGHHTLS